MSTCLAQQRVHTGSGNQNTIRACVLSCYAGSKKPCSLASEFSELLYARSLRLSLFAFISFLLLLLCVFDFVSLSLSLSLYLFLSVCL